MIWDVYDQRLPIYIRGSKPQEFAANLLHMGTVEADTSTQALARAKEKRMSLYPMVEPKA